MSDGALFMLVIVLVVCGTYCSESKKRRQDECSRNHGTWVEARGVCNYPRPTHDPR